MVIYLTQSMVHRRDLFTSFITNTENRSNIYLYNLRCSYIVQVKYFHKLNFCFLNSSNKQRTMYNYNCSFLPQILKESVYAKLTKLLAVKYDKFCSQFNVFLKYFQFLSPLFSRNLRYPNNPFNKQQCLKNHN